MYCHWLSLFKNSKHLYHSVLNYPAKLNPFSKLVWRLESVSHKIHIGIWKMKMLKKI